ncbi:hypothetical protein PG997_013808 [Apiospora hydei]|uniref:Peptidase A2 domain-containing protein n=1 Tax=Apiospora hydei TaxID=1337664 RepID=A0ABR1V797_9PEZI
MAKRLESHRSRHKRRDTRKTTSRHSVQSYMSNRDAGGGPVDALALQVKANTRSWIERQQRIEREFQDPSEALSLQTVDYKPDLSPSKRPYEESDEEADDDMEYVNGMPAHTGYIQQEVPERTTVVDRYRSPDERLPVIQDAVPASKAPVARSKYTNKDGNKTITVPYQPCLTTASASKDDAPIDTSVSPALDTKSSVNGFEDDFTRLADNDNGDGDSGEHDFSPPSRITGRKSDRWHRAQVPPVNVKNVRRALAISINNHKEKACPDSGSSENIMREDWACDHKLKIRRTPRDRRRVFELGNGKSVRAVGRVYVNVEITRAAPSSLQPRKRKVWFYVFEKCPVPIILGMPFLESEAIFTRNKHLLEACPKAYSDIDSLLWIGSPRNQIRCSLNGRQAVATVDTGSDINLMSLEYAKKNGHWIDDRPEVRHRLQFGDGSVAEIMGQVYVNNFSFDWRSPPTTMEFEEDDGILDEKSQGDNVDDTNKVYVWQQVVFHVLPDLPCDIILGRPLLEATDAFSQQEMHLSSSDHKYWRRKYTSCLNIVIDLGWIRRRTHSLKGKTRAQPLSGTGAQVVPSKWFHDDERHAHWYRLSQMEDEIQSLTGIAKQEKVDALTRVKERWEMQHRGCSFCV